MTGPASPDPPPPVDLRHQLRTYLDTLTITGDNIGEIRRSLFVPWQSQWNGWVRDETAARETGAARPLDVHAIAKDIGGELMSAAEMAGISFDDEQWGFIEQALTDAAQEALNRAAAPQRQEPLR